MNGSSTDSTELKYSCSGENEWTPDSNPPACVAIVQEPARYELHVAIDYMAGVAPSENCMKSYAQLVSSFFDSISQALTTRCSSSIQACIFCAEGCKKLHHILGVCASVKCRIPRRS